MTARAIASDLTISTWLAISAASMMTRTGQGILGRYATLFRIHHQARRRRKDRLGVRYIERADAEPHRRRDDEDQQVTLHETPNIAKGNIFASI